MYTLWNFFLKKRTFTYFLMFILSLLGFFSLLAISKESAPEVIIPIGIVTTILPNASPLEIEKLVTKVLEDDIKNAEGIDKVTSSSRTGVSVITAQFNASANIEVSIQKLKDAVDKAKVDLPKEAISPSVTKINFADQPILIVSISQDASGKEATALGDTLVEEIKKVKGISKVVISGIRDREIQVVLKKDALVQYGVSYADAISALQMANITSPIGDITVSDITYPISFLSQIKEASELNEITVTQQGGVPVYIRDIAFVSDGLKDTKEYSRISRDGNPSENALTLNIYKKSGGDVTKIAKDTRQKIEELKKTVLQGSTVVVSIDTGELVQKDLRELTRTGLETVLLVMLMLFLTIGWREALVASLSIPLSFVIAFTGLYLSNNTINFMSLFSLILAIGILVDSGIVMAEAIHTRIKIYGNAEDAAKASIQEYAWPLIAGTMTTVAVFAPLFFLSGVVGKFISSIPFTIIFVLIASILVALGFVPLLAIALTKNHKSEFEDMQEVWSHKASLWYKTFLASVLESRKVQNIFFATLGILFVFSLSLPSIGFLKVQFFPQENQEYVFVSVERQTGTPLSVTDTSVREVEEVLYASPYVASFVTTVGASSLLSGKGGGAASHIANITVLLHKDRKENSTEIVSLLRTSLKDIVSASITVDQGNNGPPSSSPVSISFSGEDLEQLSLITERAENILEKIEGTRDVTSSLKNNGTQFDIEVDKIKASQVGLSAVSIASLLRTSLSGVKATTIQNKGKDIEVIVKSDLNGDFINPEDTTKTTIDSLLGVSFKNREGQNILLGSLVDVKLSSSRASIERKDGKRIATVESNLSKNGNALDIVNAFKKKEKELLIPEGIIVQYGGDTEDVTKTFKEMGLALLSGMGLMLLILVLMFNSFRYSLYLLLTIPLSLIGVFCGLAITRQTLSFSSMLGIIALAGVIINHAIILLDSILHLLNKEKQKQKEGEKVRKLHELIIESSAIRLRPIFLTTVTTVIGMLPLAFVSALWGPLAFAIMFGLAFAMVLTLLLIPILFFRYPGRRYKNFEK